MGAGVASGSVGAAVTGLPVGVGVVGESVGEKVGLTVGLEVNSSAVNLPAPGAVISNRNELKSASANEMCAN